MEIHAEMLTDCPALSSLTTTVIFRPIFVMILNIKFCDNIFRGPVDSVNWPKLIQILKGNCIDWRERKLSSNLHMAQSVKVRLNRGKTRSVKTGRRVRQGCCLSPIVFNLYSECITREALEGLGNFKIGGQIIHTVKCADDLVLLAKEEKVLQGMIDKTIEIGGCCGMEMNVEKTKVMTISRQFPVKNYDRPKATKECGIF